MSIINGNLVLGRKVGQRLFIGDNIIIQVADISGGQVKLAISAPKDVVIQREELMDAFNITANNHKKIGNDKLRRVF